MGLYISNSYTQPIGNNLNSINKNLNKIIKNTNSPNSCIEYIKKNKYYILFSIITILLPLLL
jgi:hypothetical protein